MIKKRNLDPSLVNWIMNETGLGPGIGEIHYVAAATSAYHDRLHNEMNVPAENIHTTIAAGEEALVTDRNDVLCVFPGAHNQTASITWDKNNTHMIGLGGSNVGGDYSEPNVVIYTATAAVAEVLNITGHNCIFKGIDFENAGANSGNLCAVKLNGYGNTFKNCGIKGTMVTAQCAVAAAGSLYIHDAGMYPVFEDCQIGQDVWGDRATALSGVICFTSTSAQPNGGMFRRCRIMSRSSATATAGLVRLAATNCIGRDWLFDDCVFSNWDDGTSNVLNQAFCQAAGVTAQNFAVHLHNCSLFGVDEWQDDDSQVVWASMPVSSTSGGISREPTAAIS